MTTKTINLRLTERDFKKLQNAKEAAIICGDCSNWEEFFLNIIEKEEI